MVVTTKGTHVLFVNRFHIVNEPPEEGQDNGWVAVDVEHDVLEIVLEDDIAELKSRWNTNKQENQYLVPGTGTSRREADD
jgi:hypothetical protein